MSDTTVSLSEMLAAAFARGDGAKAIEFHGRWYDWAWMDRTAARVLGLLRAAGVADDQAIAFAPANQPACAAVLLGLIAAQREIVMIYACLLYTSPSPRD